MKSFSVILEDVDHCDKSEHRDTDLHAAFTANVRSAAMVAIDAIRDQTSQHSVLVQVEDPETGERAIAEIITSVVVTRLPGKLN